MTARWKVTLAVLVGTLTFSFAVLQRIEDDVVPDIGVTQSGVFHLPVLLVFIVLFDRFIRRLRPVAVAADVASVARSTFEQTLRSERPVDRVDAPNTAGSPLSHVVAAGRARSRLRPRGTKRRARAA